MQELKFILPIVLLFLVVLSPVNGVSADRPIIINHSCTDIRQIPVWAIEQAKSKLHIAYGHTSHGSQLISGMGSSGTQLDAFMTSNGATPGLYVWHDGPQTGALDLDDYFVNGDLGNPDRVTWAQRTREYLNNPSNLDVNVVMWSWCGQVDSSAADINTYLNLMSQLEVDYPNVTFVYMTGHLTGTGATGNVNIRNQQIRDYCIANNKILYDFADIESYDPDGLVNYMALYANDNCDYDSDGDGSLDRNWALDWQSSHTQDVDWWASGAAHSQHLNGNRKGYAAWWLWAKIAGWTAEKEISKIIEWNGNIVADFGDGRGLFINDGSSWTQLTGWGDVHNMLLWGTNLVVDFGGSRGLFVNNGSGWTQLTGWDDTSNMLVWNNGATNNLVVDFGQGRGLYYNDGTIWNLLTGWDDTSNMLVWNNGATNNLVVDFGQGRGLYYNDGATWNLLTGWDDTSNMMVWNNGAENRLVVEFGGGRGLYYNDGTTWTLMTGWDGTNRMLTWSNKLVVDFGGGRGLYYNDGTWHELTGWDDTADMITWNTGASNRLVVDFGGGRGVYYNDGFSWNNLTGYDDTHRMITWSTNLVVDFGGSHGLYYNDGAWHELMSWDGTAELMEWGTSLVSDFGPGRGVYKYTGGSWTELTGWSTAE